MAKIVRSKTGGWGSSILPPGQRNKDIADLDGNTVGGKKNPNEKTCCVIL